MLVADMDRLSNLMTADEIKASDNKFLVEWQPRTVGNALQPRPPAEFFVDKLLREASLSIVYGAPGSLKSMLVLDILASIAAGQPWLPTLPGNTLEQEAFTTSRVPCMWLDYDNGEDLTDERVEAFARAYQLQPDAPIIYYSLPIPWLDLSKRDHALAFMGLIQHKGIRVVVIDNLGLIKGGASENTDEMQPVMSHLREIANTTRCAIILIHHQRKSAANGDSSGPRKGETLRGYSGIEAACDLILHVDRPQGQDHVLITPTKVRRRAPFTSIGALFSFESDGDTLKAARFWAWPTDDAKTALLKSIKATIRQMLGEYPGANQSKIVEHVADWFATNGQKKPGRDTIRGCLKEMTRDGQVTERRGPKTSNQAELSYFNA